MVPEECSLLQGGSRIRNRGLFREPAKELLEARVSAEGRETRIGVDGGKIAETQIQRFCRAASAFFLSPLPA